MARVIELTSEYTAKVSAQDYKRVLLAGPWFAHVEKKNGVIYTVYAYRHVRRVNGKAADAYDKAAKKYHGSFAVTNAMLRGKP